MTTDFTNYKQNYQALINRAITSTGLDDDLKDRIYKLLYFLNQFPQLLTNGATNENINTEKYFVDLLTKYRDGRKKPSLKIRKDLAIGETIPDQMVRLILQKSEKCDTQKIDDYIDGHNLAMSAENLLGSLLERYIASVIEDGWIWCPGQIIFATDFIKYPLDSDERWICLQVKNADNSENSSSSKIREQFEKKGYEDSIQIWFRSQSKWTCNQLKKRIFSNLQINEDSPSKRLDKLKEKLNPILGENFKDIETWREVAKYFNLANMQTSQSSQSIADLKNVIYDHLSLTKENKLEELKKRLNPISDCNFSKTETWISIAKHFNFDDLVSYPQRDTEWDKLNEIVGLSSDNSMSEEKFSEYISSLYSDENGENVIGNTTKNSD